MANEIIEPSSALTDRHRWHRYPSRTSWRASHRSRKHRLCVKLQERNVVTPGDGVGFVVGGGEVDRIASFRVSVVALFFLVVGSHHNIENKFFRRLLFHKSVGNHNSSFSIAGALDFQSQIQIRFEIIGRGGVIQFDFQNLLAYAVDFFVLNLLYAFNNTLSIAVLVHIQLKDVVICKRSCRNVNTIDGAAVQNEIDVVVRLNINVSVPRTSLLICS
jgi:hypothetical protein